MSTLINLTPHIVNIVTPSGVINIESTGLARCSQTCEKIGEVNGISITSQVFGEVTGLPEVKLDTYYIVSRLVAAACPQRHDLLIPGPLLRDEEGRVIGCDGLSRV